MGSSGAAMGARYGDKDTGCSVTGEPGDRLPYIHGSLGLSVSRGASVFCSAGIFGFSADSLTLGLAAGVGVAVGEGVA